MTCYSFYDYLIMMSHMFAEPSTSGEMTATGEASAASNNSDEDDIVFIEEVVKTRPGVFYANVKCIIKFEPYDVYLFCYYFIDPELGVAMNVKTEHLNEVVVTTVTKEPAQSDAISGNKKE